MKKILFFLVLFVAGFAHAAMTPGGEAYTKKKSTALLQEPQRDAASVATLAWGTKVKVVKTQGLWLQATVDGKTGWIFSGNLAADKPPADNKNDFLPSAASDTTAATAARPLEQAAKDFADRKDAAAAAADVEWLEKAADAVTKVDVESFMREHHKGEFAP